MSRTPPRTPVAAAALAAAALAAALALPAPAVAQGWSGDGAPVCTAAGKQYLTRIASDGAGGAFVGWSDQRPGASGADVYLARLGPDGAPAPGWPANGLAVCTAAGAQLLYSLVPDGSGGAFLAWEDYRSGALSDVYGHHVLADGSLATGWPADGLGIAVFMEEQRDPKLVPDGAGGVFAVWADARTYAFSQRDIYAQHLQGDGTPAPGWAANGMPVTNSRTYDYAPSAAGDGTGGLYVTWTRDLGAPDVGAQHLGADGAPFATWPDTGIVLCGQPGAQGGAVVVPAPGGSAMAVWKDARNYSTGNTETNHYALRFGPDTTRAAGWPREGRRLYASTNGISAPFAASDGAGGLLYMWGELLSATDEDLFVLHVDSDGLVVTSAAFPDGIVPVCAEPNYQHPVALVPDGAGGAYVGFDDYRDAGPSLAYPDPYVQHVTAAAALAPGWPATGVALTKAATRETSTQPVAVTGGVIAVYERGADAAADLFASMVGLDGVVPALVSLVASEASPGRVRLAWQVAGAPGGEWIVERRDASSPWAEIARAFPDGEGRVRADDGAVAPGARYGYRLAPAAGGAPLGETWLEVPRETPALALHGVAPNPAREGARVRFALPEPGAARLRLLDPQGRVVREWRFEGAAGESQFPLAGIEGLAPGVYWLELVQAGRFRFARVVVAGR